MFVTTKRELTRAMALLQDDAPIIIYNDEYGEFGGPVEVDVAKLEKGLTSTVGDGQDSAIEFSSWAPGGEGIECLVINWSKAWG